MPEDSKKNSSKKSHKHEPKDQRKPRQGRPSTAPPAVPVKTEVKKDRTLEHNIPQEPGPEFYKGLKRETDEILKITEESNAKYTSKEIQSNWKKYEIPIESYEEIEEQENLGADYEKLIQAPMSIGGHFQFKHEKSWDSATVPSEYDKYFDIYSDNVGTAIRTIPFYERNYLDMSMFSEIDLSGMRNRVIKYKQKYYNDTSYTTPDLEVIEKTTNIFKECLSNNSTLKLAEDTTIANLDIHLTDITVKGNNDGSVGIGIQEINLNPVLENTENTVHNDKQIEGQNLKSVPEWFDDKDILEVSKENTEINTNVEELKVSQMGVTPPVQKETKSKAAVATKPVIESPEDLDKWLDDFLDS